MTLNNKLAFEIWIGIVVLIIVIGGVAGVTLMFGNNDVTPLLTRTQVDRPASSNTPAPSATPFVSDSTIQNVSSDISKALLGGVPAQ
jgi:uncharacterized iron-regulated membrane protein